MTPEPPTVAAPSFAPTLLTRHAAGDRAAQVLEALDGKPAVVADGEFVLWLGDVASQAAEPVAAAVLAVDGLDAEVRTLMVALPDHDHQLGSRLLRESAEAARALGCRRLVAASHGVLPAGLLAAGGMTVADATWALDL